MVLATTTQFSFTQGELSPKIRGRIDLQQYASGSEIMLNFVPELQGPASYRAGTRFVQETKNNNPAALIRFQFNDEQSYILEFTAGFIRIYTDEGILESAPSTPVEVVSPYAEAELFELQVAQNKDTMYIAHKEHNPKILTRTGPTTWTLTDHSPTGLTLTADNRPAAVAFYEQRLVYAGTNNDPQKIFFSKSADIDDFTVGTGAADGMEYTIASRDSNTIRWLISTSRQLVIGTFGGNFIARGSQTNESITPSSIFITPTDGIGAEPQIPILKNDRVIFTQTGKLILRTFEFSLEQDGFLSKDRNLLSDELTQGNIKQLAFQEGRPEVVWCAKENGELLGLSYKPEELVNGWHRHRTRDVDDITSVATVARLGKSDQVWVVAKRLVNGVTKHYVEFLEDLVEYPRTEDYFTGKNNRDIDRAKFRNFLFEKQKEYFHLDSGLTYDGSDLTTETLTPGATTGTGVTFTLSGSFFTSGMVGRQLWRKSVTGDETGRAVIKTFNSATSVDCDILVDFDSTDVIPSGEWYLTTDTVTGLDHLEAEEVQVVTDGSFFNPGATVSSGEIEITYQASVIHVGLPYVGIIKSMNLEVGGINGSSQTKHKNIYKAGIKFDNSLATKYGTNLYNTEQLLFRSSDSFMNSPPEVFTGEKRITFNDQWSGQKHTVILQEFPLPCTVQQLTAYTNTSN